MAIQSKKMMLTFSYLPVFSFSLHLFYQFILFTKLNLLVYGAGLFYSPLILDFWVCGWVLWIFLY
uniref:Uncharacterized protein n=1 Tax=Rhizophora mucronata TaxID=61149 RepID=A0A2P2P7U4_RHIMU